MIHPDTKVTHSAGGVVINTQGEVLVVNQNHDSWSLPKGHIEDGEDALMAAKREVAEESGITDLKLLKELATYSRYKIGKDGLDDMSEMKTIHMYLFSTDQLELAPTDPLNPEARWVAPDEVAELLTHPKDQEFFQSVLPLIQSMA